MHLSFFAIYAENNWLTEYYVLRGGKILPQSSLETLGTENRSHIPNQLLELISEPIIRTNIVFVVIRK